MNKDRDIKSYFEGVLENIDIILQDSCYKQYNKDTRKEIRNKIYSWYNSYKEKKTLKYIEPKELEYIQLEITDLFDKYYIDEDINKNYTERLLYDFSHLEHYWKDEMLGKKKN